MRHYLVSAVAAGVLSMGCIAGANAEVHNLGALTSDVLSGDSFAAGAIDDSYTFAMSSNGSLSAMVASLSSVLGSSSLLSKWTVTLTDSSGDILKSMYDSTEQSQSFTRALTAGDYSLRVTGTAMGRGWYAVALAPTYTTDGGTAPVPEPETYALMLAGLGLVGMIARRRSRDNPSY